MSNQGVFIVGTFVGFRSKESLNRTTGELKKDMFLGLAVPKENGFEGETDVFSIKMRDEHKEAKLLELYNSLKGKVLALPVRPFSYALRGDTAGLSWSLAGDGKPVSFKA